MARRSLLRPDQQGRAQLRRRHRQRDLWPDRQRQLEYPRGLRYKQDFGAWHFENVNEVDYAPFSTDNTSIIHQSPNAEDWEYTNDNIRKLDFTLENDRYGKFWLGQGSMATDGIYEMDLSGTTVIDYSSVADSASAQIIRFSGPGLSFDESLSGITIGNAFTNYDGPRRVRIRYDTPAFNGFTFAAAYGATSKRRYRTARGEHRRRLSHLRAHLQRRGGQGRPRLLLGRGRYPQLGRLGLGAAHADRAQRHTRRRRPGHRRRRRQLLVRQARAHRATSSPGAPQRRPSITTRATTSSSTPTPESPARPATRRSIAGAEHRPRQHRALAHLPDLRLLPTTLRATRRDRQSSAAHASSSDPAGSKKHILSQTEALACRAQSPTEAPTGFAVFILTVVKPPTELCWRRTFLWSRSGT